MLRVKNRTQTTLITSSIKITSRTTRLRCRLLFDLIDISFSSTRAENLCQWIFAGGGECNKSKHLCTDLTLDVAITVFDCKQTL